MDYDAVLFDLEPWDSKGTPPEKYPLLLNFHPLVIYRHRVLKQADVVSPDNPVRIASQVSK